MLSSSSNIKLKFKPELVNLSLLPITRGDRLSAEDTNASKLKVGVDVVKQACCVRPHYNVRG